MAQVSSNGDLRARSAGSLANGHTNGTGGLHHSQPSWGAQQQRVELLGGVKLAGCVAGGMVFGFAAEKCRVYVPSVIYNQMLFSQLTMLKVFLSAVSAGLGTFAILAAIPSTRPLFNSVRDAYGSCLSSKRWIAMATGGCILGMGMTLSGACPGMVFLQFGTGTSSAMYTLAGCYMGALLYGALEPSLKSLVYHKKPLATESLWLNKVLGIPYLRLAVVMGAMMGVVIATTEYFVPWTTEVPVSPTNVGILQQKTWSPIVAGLIMGSLQLSTAFLVRDSLGGSSSYCTVIANALKGVGSTRVLPYFSGFLNGIGNWWQLVFWLGAAGGAASSAYLSGTWGTTEGVAPWMALLGGVFMLFGARLASGCTSGHGLSGMALLSTPSFLAVPAMFAGGISLAFTIKALS